MFFADMSKNLKISNKTYQNLHKMIFYKYFYLKGLQLDEIGQQFTLHDAPYKIKEISLSLIHPSIILHPMK